MKCTFGNPSLRFTHHRDMVCSTKWESFTETQLANNFIALMNFPNICICTVSKVLVNSYEGTSYPFDSLHH